MIRTEHSYIQVIYLLFLLSACTGGRNSSPEQNRKTFATEVKTEKTQTSSQEEELTLSGKVEYDPDRVIHYVPLVSGVIERTYFSLGDKVQKGQLMLDIQSAELSALWSDYVSFEAEVELSRRKMQIAQSMYDNRLLSEKELLEARSVLKQAEASFERIQRDMSMYVHQDNGFFAIKAPMSGYVVDKRAVTGNPVSMDGGALFIIADLSNVWITANVYAGDLQFVREGMEARISTLSYPGEVFEGRINTLSQVFDPEEKVLKARIVMPNTGLKFKPEMAVIVTLKNQTANHLTSLPSNALIFDDNTYYVVVKTSPGNFQIKEVTPQSHYNKTTYLRTGLAENEEVVIENQLLLYAALREK
jgi:cobalt-zinc-cadmium efflux system membrane fusion protein